MSFIEKRHKRGRISIYVHGFRIFSYRKYVKRDIPQLNTCKYVHIMNNDKFNKPFVDFLNSYFNPKEHLVLCIREFDNFPFPEGDNVVEINSLKEVNLYHDNIQKIVFHSLIGGTVKYLYANPNILKEKAYWGIWGADLYNAERDKIHDYVRSNFRGYLTGADRYYLLKKYQIANPCFYYAEYIFPISIKMLQKAKKQPKNYILIQLNNSCDKSTLEMLDCLSKFKDENIKIKTILSYGDLKYKDEIIQKGISLFGDKFEYIDVYMPPQEYTDCLAQNDILILNQDRQQGVGNLTASLYFGAKIFIKKDVSTSIDMKNSGFIIFDSENIKDMSFDEFTVKNYQQKDIAFFFDLNHKKEVWDKIFKA